MPAVCTNVALICFVVLVNSEVFPLPLSPSPVLRVVSDISLDRKALGVIRNPVYISPAANLKEAKCFGLSALTLSSLTDDFRKWNRKY